MAAKIHVNTRQAPDIPASFIDEAQLIRLARIADRLLVGNPLAFYGQRPHKSQPGRGQEFLDFRDYTPGDDSRQIDWRASNRSQQPQIRRYRDDTASDWTLCLDRSASMGLHDKWSKASRLAAALAYLILHRGNRVALITFSDTIDSLSTLGVGRNHYAQLLKQLTACQPRQSGGDSCLGVCAGAIKPRASIIVISDFLTDNVMQPDLQQLQQTGSNLHAFQLLASNECRLDTKAPLSLIDIERRNTLNIASPDIAEKEATIQLDSLKHTLRQYCRQQGITLTQCDTSESWDAVLVRHLSHPLQQRKR